MKNISRIIIASIFFLLFHSCSPNKICYDYYLCRNKFSMSVDVRSIDKDSILISINNLGIKKLIMYKSLEIFFYKYNQNLRSPHHDSVDNNLIIEYVRQSTPVNLTKAYFNLPVSISQNSPYTLRIAKSTIFNIVKEFGNLDNKFQLRNCFQIFVKSSNKKHGEILLASNIFTLN